MKRLVLMILALFTAVSLFAAESSDVRDILKKLDSYIEDSNRYVAAKNENIAAIQEELSKKGGQDYDLNYALFDEYKSFRFDSAYFYAGKAFELARESQNKEQIVQSHYAKAFCYLSSGLFLEAFYEMSLINPSDVPYALKDEYYVLYTRLYHAASEYSETAEWSGIYAGKSAQYADSVLAVVPKDSYKHLFMDAQKAANSGRKELGIKIYKEILYSFDVEEHFKAVINSSIGAAYKDMGQVDSAIVYFAKAAIHDIVSATKETTALYHLAEIMLEQEEYKEADRYIDIALVDAKMYNASRRTAIFSLIHPQIEQARFDSVRRQRNYMLVIVLLCLLIIGLLAMAYITFERHRKHTEQRNRQLREANSIKEEYIGNTFYLNSEYISDLEKLYEAINRKLSDNQYEDIKNLCKQSSVNKKREIMYKSFDKCFLKIFPSFISEYAKLFPPGHIDPEADSLTSEMRIFALMRLGITDAEKISNFLNYSVHTVYTYKTRAKNKAIVDNEEFENRIKSFEIG